ncbi:lectin-like [Rhododendron vialii]|uniref:lectin-like n=1 Tax=Rhododendron vialii TaxID=182163 RepID=UPI00265ECE99|nr:lectin-like [Rhododendron vialii]
MGTRWSQDETPQVREEAPPQITEQGSTSIPIISHSTEKDSSRVSDATPPEVKLPHNYEAIVKHADSPFDSSSTEKLYNQLQAGVFLNQEKKKYWVDRKSSSNSFMLFARDLSITWAEDNRYWHWSYLKETSDVFVDVAELLKVCWLEIQGKFEMVNLSPRTVYEVVFLVMLKDPAFGWEVPVNVMLILPDGTTQQHEENLMEKPRGRWIEIPAGEFRTSSEKIGDIQFSLYEYKAGMWKRGLVIKGVAIRPKA